MTIDTISLHADVPVDVTALHHRYRIDLGAVTVYLAPETLHRLHGAIGEARREATAARIGCTESDL